MVELEEDFRLIKAAIEECPKHARRFVPVLKHLSNCARLRDTQQLADSVWLRDISCPPTASSRPAISSPPVTTTVSTHSTKSTDREHPKKRRRTTPPGKRNAAASKAITFHAAPAANPTTQGLKPNPLDSINEIVSFDPFKFWDLNHWPAFSPARLTDAPNIYQRSNTIELRTCAARIQGGIQLSLLSRVASIWRSRQEGSDHQIERRFWAETGQSCDDAAQVRYRSKERAGALLRKWPSLLLYFGLEAFNLARAGDFELMKAKLPEQPNIPHFEFSIFRLELSFVLSSLPAFNIKVYIEKLDAWLRESSEFHLDATLAWMRQKVQWLDDPRSPNIGDFYGFHWWDKDVPMGFSQLLKSVLADLICRWKCWKLQSSDSHTSKTTGHLSIEEERQNGAAHSYPRTLIPPTGIANPNGYDASQVPEHFRLLKIQPAWPCPEPTTSPGFPLSNERQLPWIEATPSAPKFRSQTTSLTGVNDVGIGVALTEPTHRADNDNNNSIAHSGLSPQALHTPGVQTRGYMPPRFTDQSIPTTHYSQTLPGQRNFDEAFTPQPRDYLPVSDLPSQPADYGFAPTGVFPPQSDGYQFNLVGTFPPQSDGYHPNLVGTFPPQWDNYQSNLVGTFPPQLGDYQPVEGWI